MKVKCPNCENKTDFNEKNPYRPFCSKRCKLIDFGKWANGEYSIETAHQDESANGNSEE